jgi:cobalt-zinc-cadmium efflux system outer membrane protein
LARRSSPELAAARQALAAAQGRTSVAGAFPNPMLEYGREQTSRDGLRNSQNVLSLEQSLDFFGRRGARRTAANALARAAAARVEAAEAGLDYEVTRLYATALAAERRAALAREAADAFSRALRQSQTRLAGGDISGYQHRRLRLEAARYEAGRLAMEVARDSSLRHLALLTGLAPADLALVDSLPPSPVPLSVDSLVARTLATRAELRAAAFEVEAAEAEVRVVRLERLSPPAVTAGFKTESVAAGDRLSGFVLGVSLALPIWDRRAGAISAGVAEAARRSAQLESLRREAIREVHAALGMVQSLSGQLAALELELGEEARRARGAAETAYQEGEIGLLEWLDSVRAYHEAETTYVTLWSEYVTRRAALERVTGVALF